MALHRDPLVHDAAQPRCRKRLLMDDASQKVGEMTCPNCLHEIIRTLSYEVEYQRRHGGPN